VVNCAALPETLLESELFGHTRGAFTGATQARRGLFLDADGGTLLLDEIGELSPPLQARLLRVLESGEVRALGSDTIRIVDVRIVAATHQPLSDLVHRGDFREDLYFRLKVLPIVIPPAARARRRHQAAGRALPRPRPASVCPRLLRAPIPILGIDPSTLHRRGKSRA
jgi:two-component system response regulator HydG